MKYYALVGQTPTSALFAPLIDNNKLCQTDEAQLLAVF
jgi:hypothetical protein